MTRRLPGTVIASFPRSGSTWVRFLIANLFNRIAPEIDAVDFHNIHEIVPDMGRHDDRRLFLSLPPVWKTHDAWRPGFDRAVLVIRNPWDVMLSYHAYACGEWGRRMSLADLVSGKDGIVALVRHAASYLDRCPDLLVLTYESLHTDPLPHVRTLADFLGVKTDDGQVAAAVRASSFDRMRQIEETKGRKYGGSGFRFIRSGTVGAGAAAIAAEPDLDRLIRRELARCRPLHDRYAAPPSVAESR